jgi:hypothetical protein
MGSSLHHLGFESEKDCRGRDVRRRLGSACVASVGVLLCGCMTKLAVSAQAGVLEQAAPVVEAQTDYEFARAAIPGNLMQIEGILGLAPEDERLLLLIVKGLASYAYAFLEEDMERARTAGDFEQADVLRQRAREMYLKAKRFGVQWLTAKDSGLGTRLSTVSAAAAGEVKADLAQAFDDAEDAPALFWTGYAWGSAINVSRDDPALLADLPLVTALVERSVELDERYYHAAGHVFLGVLHASRGAVIGGDPKLGKQHFERALELTDRKSLIVHANYAEAYAVQVQDGSLFEALLQEVRSAGAAATEGLALANAVAKRRATRLGAQRDELILPALPDPVLPERPVPTVAPEPPEPEPPLTSR